MSSIIERQAGTCPVCQRVQKVYDDGRMVHHGYQRPGHGYIEGDCFGVNYPAYELSDAGCRAFHDRCASSIERTQELLAYHRTTRDPITVTNSWNKTARTLTVDDGWKYDDAKKDKIRELESRLGQLRDAMADMARLIREWTMRPLITVKELAAQDASVKQQKRDAKSVVLAAARDKALSNHAKNFKRVEKLLPRLTDAVLADLAKVTPPDIFGFSARRLGARSALDSVTKSIEIASLPPGEFGTKAEWQEWGSLPAKAAETIKEALDDLGYYREGRKQYALP